MQDHLSPFQLEITADKSRIDLALVHRFLSEESYWAQGISEEIVARAIDHSHCFTALHEGRQVGFARVVSDDATFAYLCDVFVVPAYRGRGVGKSLVSFILNYSALQGLRRWMLMTLDAHELYRSFGFTELNSPTRAMEIVVKDIYRR